MNSADSKTLKRKFLGWFGVHVTNMVAWQAIVLAIFLGISFSSHAQTGTPSPVPPDVMSQTIAALLVGAGSVSPVPPDAVPQSGIFYSTQNFPPTPFDWSPDLPVYSLGQGNFLIDDSSVDYSAREGAWRRGSDEGMRPMDDSVAPSPPGGGGDGTNSSGGGVSSSGAFFSTNGLWMQITGITNGIVSLNLNNPTNQVYAIWSGT